VKRTRGGVSGKHIIPAVLMNRYSNREGCGRGPETPSPLEGEGWDEGDC